MLSPKYLEDASDDLIKIYSQLELDVIKFMASRLEVGKGVDWQGQMLKEAGAVRGKIEQLVKKYDKDIQDGIFKAFDKAAKQSIKNDNRIFIEAIGREVTRGHEQIILAMLNKTYGTLHRLTMTTAQVTEQAFIQQANNAYMQAVSGAMSYEDALYQAVDNLADAGIQVVHYQKGQLVRRSIESAVKMNIRTGINQTSSAITLENCTELGADLVETTAHIGARPEHEIWQGQVFSLSGNNPKYPSFEICGYGEPDGICGINCRHSFHPYYEGIEPRNDAEDLARMESWSVEVDGKECTRYEAEQRMRQMERFSRKYEKRAMAEKIAGLDSSKSEALALKWRNDAKDFAGQTSQHFVNANFKVGGQ